ncbi:MAG: AraC family transcriptional regulator [Pseudomonadota bacterium]
MTSLFVRKVVAAADGFDREALLRSVGLDPAGEADVGQMVDDTAYYGLMERIAHELDDAIDFPLRVGGSMRCDDYGAFGLAWKTAPTLRDSFLRATRYWRLLTSVSEYEIRDDGSDTWFVLHRAGERRLGLRLSNEATLASVMTIMREVATGPVAPVEVHCRHRAPPSTTAHEAWFGCPMRFGSDYDAILMPAAMLSRPNRLADEGLTRFLIRHLDDALARVEAAITLRQRVRDAIATSLSAGVPRMAVVARRMGMSERTLQRRLGEEGLSFQEIVEGARRELAEGLLSHSDYALAEIGFLTGFSEQSAFTRAFKRWCATTPAAYRAAHRPG